MPLKSAIYRKAAEVVFESIDDGTQYYNPSHRGCCHGIAQATQRVSYERRVAYQEAFSQVFRPACVGAYWFGWPASQHRVVNRDRAEHRIYALLLMAEMAKENKS